MNEEPKTHLCLSDQNDVASIVFLDISRVIDHSMNFAHGDYSSSHEQSFIINYDVIIIYDDEYVTTLNYLDK